MEGLERDNLIASLYAGSTLKDGHLLWQYPLSRGYGMIWFNGKRVRIHRLSAHLFLGLDIANKDLHALHKDRCQYRNCWKPDCLYIGSHTDNMEDRKRLNVFCPRGHEYASHSGMQRQRGLREGRRYCQTCKVERAKQLRHSKSI